MSEPILIIPALNEESTIVDVLVELHDHAPNLLKVVVDNGSQDKTAELVSKVIEDSAIRVILLTEHRKGKGFAYLKALESYPDASFYGLLDGDSTYDVSLINQFVEQISLPNVDMVIGQRKFLAGSLNFKLRLLLNNLLAFICNLLFKNKLDYLSGFRLMKPEVAKFYNNKHKGGFDLEIILTLMAIKHKKVIQQSPIFYANRPTGSTSKINLAKDGFLIVGVAIRNFLTYKNPY